MTREFQGPKLNGFTAYMFVFSAVRNCKIWRWNSILYYVENKPHEIVCCDL